MGGLQMRLKYVDRFVDRHGKERLYFRRPGGQRTPMPGALGSPKFVEAYAAALAAKPGNKAPPDAGAPGTFRRLRAEYFGSIDFLRTKPSSQRTTRGILEPFFEKHGHRLVKQMTRGHVQDLVAAKKETPAAANNLLKKLRALMGFAIANGWRTDDPTAKIKRFKEGEYHTWTDEQVRQFEARWPLGTRQRTAFALALYTGQRRGDLARMTWSDIDPTRCTITVVQEKTGARLRITLHSKLQLALAAWERKHMVVLATSYGKAPTAAGFGNYMAEAFDAAGLPQECVLHGIRKAAARRLAEAGCSTRQIMAITGHKSLEEIERYTSG
ncbi:MAG: tyrosine-type recombinase/integrase [Microvirga sp.]